jgi:hypothetical protein
MKPMNSDIVNRAIKKEEFKEEVKQEFNEEIKEEVPSERGEQ